MLAAGLGLALVRPVAAADETNKATFKDDREKASYAAGMFFGSQLRRSNMDIDPDVMASALKDVLAGRETKLTDMQVRETLTAYQQAAQKKVAEKNKKDGEAFLAENAKKPGVKTYTVTLPDGTSAQMQYKVISEGTGAIPKSNDVVSANYKGTLIDGKEFDSSAKHGPLKRPVNSLIKGWTEALQLMKVGSKWELYLPSTLAYGDRGTMGIEPGSTLIFELELLGIEAPQPPPAPPQPLTSDIIKVPSADELKKGAKIEVIKAEDAARMAAEAQKNSEKKDEKK